MASKIGIISDEISWRLDEAVVWAVENNVHFFELRSIGGDYVHLIKPQWMETVAFLLESHKIEVTAIASGFGKCDLQEEGIAAQQLDILRDLVENAQIVGTNLIRAFAGWRYKDLPATWPKIVDFFKRALDILPDDMKLAVENEPATGCATLDDVSRLSLSVGDDRIVAIFDPGNYCYNLGLIRALSNLRGSTDLSYDRLLNKLLDAEITANFGSIAIVHCKNTWIKWDLHRMDPETVKLDGGIIDFPAIFKRMQESDVPFDLEPHRAEEGKQLDEALRATPGGENYGSTKNALEDLEIIRAML